MVRVSDWTTQLRKKPATVKLYGKHFFALEKGASTVRVGVGGGGGMLLLAVANRVLRRPYGIVRGAREDRMKNMLGESLRDAAAVEGFGAHFVAPAEKLRIVFS